MMPSGPRTISSSTSPASATAPPSGPTKSSSRTLCSSNTASASSADISSCSSALHSDTSVHTLRSAALDPSQSPRYPVSAAPSDPCLLKEDTLSQEGEEEEAGAICSEEGDSLLDRLRKPLATSDSFPCRIPAALRPPPGKLSSPPMSSPLGSAPGLDARLSRDGRRPDGSAGTSTASAAAVSAPPAMCPVLFGQGRVPPASCPSSPESEQPQGGDLAAASSGSDWSGVLPASEVSTAK
mmetsp:Transcript_40596/g.114975  ORF Transcript_40596/g.114975 Transcript_40596/m.114975 type:complete len:239 (+) Transcript_40596:1319-2035(+)